MLPMVWGCVYDGRTAVGWCKYSLTAASADEKDKHTKRKIAGKDDSNLYWK